MSALALLGIYLSLGALVQLSGRAPARLAPSINWWILNVALPALVLELVPGLRFDPQLWFLVVSMWIVFAGAWLAAALAGRWLNWSRGRIGAVTLMAGLGNTAFLGYPLIEALRGREGLALAVVADQLGSFIALATAGSMVAAIYSGRALSATQVVRKVAFFPPFLSLVAAVLMGLSGLSFPPAANTVLGALGATLSPLALFSVGLRFRPSLNASQLAAVTVGLGWKMVLAPLLVFALGSATGITGLTLAIGVMQAAMAPMVTAAVISDQNGLDFQVSNTMLGIGILLSFLTVPALSALL